MATRTHVGAVRQRNEDAAYADPDHRFFIVADGMGGHAAGEVASVMAVSAVGQALDAARDELDSFACAPSEDGRASIRALLERAVGAVNADVLARSQRELDKHGMGTTLEVVLILAGEAFIAHVGDCRTYLVRGDSAVQATVDHTVAQAMYSAGALTAEEAEQSSMRTVLANAVGVSPEVMVDHIHFELEPGDRLLLCSDGLYDYFGAADLARCVSRHRGDRALAELIDRACIRGGHDNITGIIVEIGKPSAAPLEPFDRYPSGAYRVAHEARRRGPLADIDDDALTSFVEDALHESSQPHALPAV